MFDVHVSDKTIRKVFYEDDMKSISVFTDQWPAHLAFVWEHLNLLLSLRRMAQKAGLTSFGSHLWCNHLFGIILVKVVRRNWVIALQKSVTLLLSESYSTNFFKYVLKQTKITKWMCTKHSTIVLCTLNYASNVSVTDYLYNMKGSK